MVTAQSSRSMSIMLLLMFVVLATANKAVSQSQNRVGAFAGFDIDLHNAQFAKITSLGYCCPTDFGSVNGATMYGGLSYELIPAFGLTERLGLALGLGFQQRSLNTSFQATTYINDPETNQGTDASIDYTMELNRSDVFLDVMPRFALTSALRLSAGARVSYGVTSSMNQREELPGELARLGYYFIDVASQERLPYRNIYEGAIPEMGSIAVALSAGISYDIPLNQLGTVILTPGLWYRYQPSGFTEAVTSRTVDPVSGSAIEQLGSWSIQSVGASLALHLTSKPTVELQPCQEIVNGVIVDKTCPPGAILRIDPATKECRCEDTLRVDTAIVTLNGLFAMRDGVRESQPLQRINVVRSPKTNYLPLMYAVAFGDASSNIDLVNRYIEIGAERKKSFQKEKSFSRLYQRHVLNIVGAKYVDGGLTTLSIVGFTNPNEAGGDALALERAMKVREYLYRRWGMPLSAFQVRAATKEERSTYASSFEKVVDQRVALIFLNGTSRVMDFITVEDKYTRVDPKTISVEATVDLGASKSVASMEYQLRLGGNTGGKMVQPVRSAINSDGRKLEGGASSWKVALSGPGADIEPSLYGLPVGESAKLIPSLRVTSTSGQIIEAERDNATSVVPIRVVEDASGQSGLDDSLYATVVLLDVPSTSELYQQQRVALNELLSSMSLGQAVVQYRQANGKTMLDETSAVVGSEVRMILQSKGAKMIEALGDGRPVIDREDPLGMQGAMHMLIRMQRLQR